MFTGIIEEVGALLALAPRFTVRAAVVGGGLRTGDSVSVNGVCLTVVEPGRDGFTADVSPETLERSTLGALRPGAALNLERAMPAGGRLGGHIVQGHIDGVGEIMALHQAGGGNWWLEVAAPPELDRYLVFKGSVAIDGISLTVARAGEARIAVAVIPHTFAQTNLRGRRPGDRVNLECDVLAKYVEKMLGRIERPAGLSVERLREQGF
jgi:riboflavin synthase